jgi:hypothetical protein
MFLRKWFGTSQSLPFPANRNEDMAVNCTVTTITSAPYEGGIINFGYEKQKV